MRVCARVHLCVYSLLLTALQKDSGDEEDMEKNSDEEDGQLEEQIERLQEKVESAQSEQKNLFLVVFQVSGASPPVDYVGSEVRFFQTTVKRVGGKTAKPPVQTRFRWRWTGDFRWTSEVILPRLSAAIHHDADRAPGPL